MANNSNHIMNRYGKWITNKQKERLRKLYKGYRQSTAGDMRSQYLNAHKGMYGVRTTASAYGLGEGYVARKKAQMDSSLAEAGRQYASQADAAFENNAVRPAANATIQAENERKQREYEEKLRKAREKVAKQAKAQADYEKALEEYNRNKNKTDKENAKRLAEYKKAMAKYKKELKNAKQRGEKLDRLPQRQVLHGGQPLPKGLSLSADLHQYEGATSTPKPLKPLPKGKGKGKGKGRGGLLSTDMYEYESGTGHQPTATSHQGLNNRPVAPKTNYAANQTAVQNRKKAKEAVVGKPTKPILAIDNTPIPVPPHVEKDLIAKAEAMKPEEIPQLKTDYINSAVEHENLVGDLYNALKPDMNRVGLAQEFYHWVGVAQNTALSPAERKQAAMYASRAAEEYNLQDNGKAHKEQIAMLTQMVNDSHDQLVQQQFLLQQKGVRMSEDEIGFDTGYLRQYGAIPAQANDTAYAQAQALGDKNSDLGKQLRELTKMEYLHSQGLPSGQLSPQMQAFIKENNLGWLIDQEVLDRAPLVGIETAIEEKLKKGGDERTEYLQRKGIDRVQRELSTSNPVAIKRLIGSGESITHLKKLSQTDVSLANIQAMATGGGHQGKTSNEIIKELKKRLDLPSGYISFNTLTALKQDDASVAFINYCYATGQADLAKQYIFDLTEAANKAAGEKQADKISDLLPDGWKWIPEFMYHLGYGASNAIWGKIDFFRGKTPTRTGAYTQEGIIQNEIERGWSEDKARNWANALTSAGENFTDLAIGTLAGNALGAAGDAIGGTMGNIVGKVASHAPGISMGWSAAGNAKQEMLKKGYNEKAATLYGIFSGASEAVLQEQFGGLVGFGDWGAFTKALSGLVDQIPNAAGRTAINAVLDVASEIGQEEFGNILDSVYKSVVLGEGNDVYEDFKGQFTETAVTTAISTFLLNAIGLHGQMKQEKTKTRIAQLTNSSVNDAQRYLDIASDIEDGKHVDPVDVNFYNETTAAIWAAVPQNIREDIANKKTSLNDWLASKKSNLSAVAKGLEGKKSEVYDTEDHTEKVNEISDQKGKGKYMLELNPTGKKGNMYYTTVDGKEMDVSKMDQIEKRRYITAQKMSKAFDNIDIVLHDKLFGYEGETVTTEGGRTAVHLALDSDTAISKVAAHELIHALKSSLGKEEYNDILAYIKTESDAATYDAVVGELKEKGYAVDTDEYNDEVGAYLGERLFTDDTFLDRIMAGKAHPARVKLLNGLKKVVDKLAKVFGKESGYDETQGKVKELQKRIEAAFAKMSKEEAQGETLSERAESMKRERQRREAREQQLEDEAEFNREERRSRVKGKEQEVKEYDNSIGSSFTEGIKNAGEAVDTNGERLFRYRDYNADEQLYRDMAKEANLFESEEEADKFFGMMRSVSAYIEKQVKEGKIESLDYEISEADDFHPEDWDEDEERTYSPVKPNSDPLYKWSVDFSTLCRKRLLQQTVQKRLEEKLKRNLSVDEQIAVRKALVNLQAEGKKIEVACALCYVEAARFRSPKQISRFMSDRRGFLLKQIQDAALADKFKDVREEVKAKYGVENMKELRKDAKAKAEFERSINELRDAYTPTAEEQSLLDAVNDYDVTDFTTPAGLEKLARGNRKLYDAYTTFIRQATKSKALETSTPWRAGDSAKITDAEIESFNKENGLRENSWSDFQVMHLMDYISSIIELSTRGAKMQAYTKVANYAKLMGETGVMINLSLIPTAKYTKGSKMTDKSDYDPVEGMDFTTALELRDRYANTVGTICIATNDEQLEALLANDDVDMVIPYHASGMSKANRKKMGIPDWQSYEKFQNEKEIALDKSKQTKDYHKPIKFSDWFNYDLAVLEARQYGAKGAMQRAAERYLDLCEERGYTPKFADHKNKEGYWKLLIDRKMINQKTGEIIRQDAVKPVFDEGTIMDIINDEVKHYKETNADFEAASDAVYEKFKDGDFKTTKADQKAADAVNNQIVSAIMGGEERRARTKDSEYLSLAEKYRDGTATEEEKAELEKRVEEAAKKAGYTLKAYHATNNNFTIFDKAKRGKQTDFNASSLELAATAHIGFWFNNNDVSGMTGQKRSIASYLNLNNPLEYDSLQDLADAIRESYANDWDELDDDFYIDDRTVAASKAADAFVKKTRAEGYDAVIINDEELGGISYAVFDPSQIKSADPVTYDDNGGIIPLSERFNAGNEDIRFREKGFNPTPYSTAVSYDSAAVREAAKTGQAVTKDGYEIAVTRGEDNAYTVSISKDGETFTRKGKAVSDLKGADIERTTASLMRNIKRGKPNSTSTSTAGIYIEKGEIPARDVNIPVSVKEGMRTSKLARTIAEASGMTEESVDELMDRVYDGFMSYKPDVNQESMDKALAKVEDDMAGAVTEWNEVVNKGKILSPDDVALGSALMVSASQSGNINEAMEIAAQLQDLATTGGKLVQSFRMIKRLGAAGAFYYINRQVAKINAELKKAAKGYKIEINQDLVNQLLAATDYHDIRDITEEIRKDLGHQLKPTLKDWLTAWRYTAMLGNLRTLDRNLLGNAGFIPIVMMKNVVNVGLQGAAKVLSGGKFQKTARLFASKQYTDFAKWDWNDQVKYDIKGNKYNDEANEIKQYMRYDMGAKGVLKIPAKVFNAWRSATTHAMEDERLLGDMAFKKAHYDYTLATRLQQQNVDTERLKSILTKARNGETFKDGSEEARLLGIYSRASEYAQQEANRNTYNDINAFARYISQMSKRAKESNNKVVRAAHYAIEGILPFKNTPANIISRAVEYSPIGMARTIALDIGRLAKGKITGEQFIENLAKGITGSGLFALGAILAKSGILRGALGYDDDEDKDLKRKGHQSYSIEVFGKSITLDWLAPECIPLFMGVEFFNQMGDMSVDVWNEKGLKALLNVTTGAFEPMLNMSMLQGVNALFEGFKSKDDLAGLSKAFATIGTSYLTQFEPTLFGQFARTLDPYRRSTYIDKNSKLPPFISKFWQTAIKKIPGATDTLLPYVNEWGEKEKTPQWWVRALENFLSPAYINDLTETDVDREITRLFENTAEKSVFPDSANKKVTYAGETYDLTQKEYEQYAVMRGETAYALAQEMIGTQWYNGLSDIEKVTAFADAYAYADTIASSAILDGRLGANAPDLETLARNKNRLWVPKANEYAKLSDSPTALADYISIKTYTDGMKADGSSRFGNISDYTYVDSNGENKVDWSEMKNDYLNSLGLSSDEVLYLADAFGIKDGVYEEAQAIIAETPGLTADAYTEALNKFRDLDLERDKAKGEMTDEEFKAWETEHKKAFYDYLNTSKLTGQQKFALLKSIKGAGWDEKAATLADKNIDYDSAWDAIYYHSNLKSTDEASKSKQFYAYLAGKNKLTAEQKFAVISATVGSDYPNKVEELVKQGIGYDAAWNALHTAKTATSTDDAGVLAQVKQTIGKERGLNGKQRFALLGICGGKAVKEKADSFAKQYGMSYDTAWAAMLKYNDKTCHGAEYHSWVDQQSATAKQKFLMLEFTNGQSSWLEKADAFYKEGVKYETTWKIARFAEKQSGRGKKDRIIAYAKSLGLSSKQAEAMYEKFGR